MILLFILIGSMLQYGGVPYHLNNFCKHTKALHLGCLYFLPCTFQNMPLVLVPTRKCRLILHAQSKRVSNISQNLNSKSKSFSCLEPQTWNQFFAVLLQESLIIRIIKGGSQEHGMNVFLDPFSNVSSWQNKQHISWIS